jgi:ABC-type multidrug transport system fused ATPase/permease subunit
VAPSENQERRRLVGDLKMKKLILGFLTGVYLTSKGVMIALGLIFIILILSAWLSGAQHLSMAYYSVEANVSTANLDVFVGGRVPFMLYMALFVFTVGTVVTGIYYVVRFFKQARKFKKENGRFSSKLLGWLKEN